MYTITSNERKWITVVTSINTNGDIIPNYYIFKRMRSTKDYLAFYEYKTTFGMQRKN